VRSSLAALALLLICTFRCFAPPPLVTGDVPTADKHTFEWYVGGRYQESESGKPSRLLPFTELVYGLTDKQELTFEIAGLSTGHEYGLNDAVVGTKYVFLEETELRPGVAGSFELKLPTGDKDRGLGSGEFDYDLRLRTQKTWGWFTALLTVSLIGAFSISTGMGMSFGKDHCPASSSFISRGRWQSLPRWDAWLCLAGLEKSQIIR